MIIPIKLEFSSSVVFYSQGIYYDAWSYGSKIMEYITPNDRNNNNKVVFPLTIMRQKSSLTVHPPHSIR